MELILLDDARLIQHASLWLTDKDDREWLDFGNGARQMDADVLMAMVRDDKHIIRAFTADHSSEAIGLVGLAGVDHDFRSAVLWSLLGDRHHGTSGYVLRATGAMLTLGFTQYGLECVNAWAVEGNHDSLRVLKQLNFKAIGRQRGGHHVDGQAYDRLLFELQANDHRSHPIARKPFTPV